MQAGERLQGLESGGGCVDRPSPRANHTLVALTAPGTSVRNPQCGLGRWLRRRLRLYLWRQWRTRQNRVRGVTPSRCSKVCRSGRSWFTNGALAHVRPSGGPTSPTQRLFRSLGLPESMRSPKPNSVEPPWYGPVCPVVWEGWRREASPYPDLGRTPILRWPMDRRPKPFTEAGIKREFQGAQGPRSPLTQRRAEG